MLSLVRLILVVLIAAYFLIGGVAHFTMTEQFVAAMPAYLGYHVELVLLSGVFEILGGAGILIPRTRLLAGYGLMALSVAVFPANVHMAMNPEIFPDMSQTALYVRLPLQGVLIWLIWIAIGKERTSRKGA